MPSFAAKLSFALLLTLTAAGLAAPPAADFVGDPRMGTCTHFAQGWDYEKILPLIEKSGLGWVRDDLDWQSCEQARGEYKIPDRTLAWIRAIHAHHIRLLLILNGQNKLYADHYDPKAYANWAAWVAKELSGDVDALEILNEPNNFGFSKLYGGQHDGQGDSPWVAKYVTLMNAAAPAIKATNPSMPVIGFGAGAAVSYKQLALGTSPAVDGIVDHPYSDHTPPEIALGPASEQIKKFGFSVSDERGTFDSLIEGFRLQSTKFNGPKQIWLTEWGFSTFQPLTASHFGGFTESAQAKYILRRFVACMGLGVDASFLYDFRDDHNDDHDAESRWGLVRHDGQPKESYGAIANLAAALHGYHAVHGGEAGAADVFGAATWPQQAPIAVYRFADDKGRPAVAVWATDRAGSDLQPRVGDIELMWGAGINAVESVDLLTGAVAPVEFQRRGERLIRESETIHDYPIIYRAVGPISPASVAAAYHPDELKIFDKGTPWGFSNGQEFPGASGSFALTTENDKPRGTFNFDFTKGGEYISAETAVQIPATAAELRLAVKAKQCHRLSIRLIDATGQCHQFVAGCSGTGEWESLRIALDRSASEHWSGANDGKLHFPIEKIALCVDKPADAPVGIVEFTGAAMVPR